MEQAQARALRDAILDQDAEETVPAAPSRLDTAQALRGLPAIARGVPGTQRGTRPGHSSRGRDRLYGKAGNDRLVGGSNRDKLYGNGGRDKLYGGKARDLLVGGAMKDTLDGGKGKDKAKKPGPDVLASIEIIVP